MIVRKLVSLSSSSFIPSYPCPRCFRRLSSSLVNRNDPQSSCKPSNKLSAAHCPAWASRRYLQTTSHLAARGSRRVVIQDEQYDDYAEEKTSPVIPEGFPKMYKSRTEQGKTHEMMRNLLQKENVDFRDLVDNAQLSQKTDDELEFGEIMRKERDQAKKVARPEMEAKETSVVLFPGQGSQFVGMGSQLQDFPNVRQIYQAASELLKYDLMKLCLEGPKEELDRTVHCQTAVFVTSIAALEKLKQEHPMAVEACSATAGFSVGEYAALVFAGSIDFEKALKLVETRAEAMQSASESVSGGMLSVLIDSESALSQAMSVAKRWCSEKKDIARPVCRIANYLFPEGKVIAGNIEALDFIEANAKQFGIRPLKRLPVSGAFHTSLMFEARDALYQALADAKFRTPTIPVLSNVMGAAYPGVSAIRKLLIQQIDQPVKWEQIVHCLYERRVGDDFPRTFEVGPGRQLGAILKRVNAKAYAKYTAVEV